VNPTRVFSLSDFGRCESFGDFDAAFFLDSIDGTKFELVRGGNPQEEAKLLGDAGKSLLILFDLTRNSDCSGVTCSVGEYEELQSRISEMMGKLSYTGGDEALMNESFELRREIFGFAKKCLCGDTCVSEDFDYTHTEQPPFVNPGGGAAAFSSDQDLADYDLTESADGSVELQSGNSQLHFPSQDSLQTSFSDTLLGFSSNPEEQVKSKIPYDSVAPGKFTPSFGAASKKVDMPPTSFDSNKQGSFTPSFGPLPMNAGGSSIPSDSYKPTGSFARPDSGFGTDEEKERLRKKVKEQEEEIWKLREKVEQMKSIASSGPSRGSADGFETLKAVNAVQEKKIHELKEEIARLSAPNGEKDQKITELEAALQTAYQILYVLKDRASSEIAALTMKNEELRVTLDAVRSAYELEVKKDLTKME